MTVTRKTYPEEISDEELSNYGYESFSGEIVLVEDYDHIISLLPELRSTPVFGFDTETRPVFRKGRKNGVALLQLSTDKRAYLFRLNKAGLPAPLASILSDKRIIKAGVAIHDDIKLLQARQNFRPQGFIDLQSVAKHLGVKNFGLKKMAAIFLGFKISKKQQVTDWEAEKLTEAQQIYAATDAWICHQIYAELAENGSLNDFLKLM